MSTKHVRRMTGPALVALLSAVLSPTLFAAKFIEPLGPVRQASATRAEDDRPAIASDALGNTVVVWAGLATSESPAGIYLQAFDSSGRPADRGPLRVDDSTLEFIDEPAVAMAPAGEFVVVWQGTPGGGVGHDILVRRYQADRRPIDAKPFRVNTSITGDQRDPAVAMGPDGEIVVTWTSDRPAEPGLSDIRAQRFSIAEAPGSTELEFTITAGSAEQDPGDSAVAMGTQGRYVVVWDSQARFAQGDIIGRAFDDDGPASDEKLMPVSTVGEQQQPAVAMNALGSYVVTWRDQADSLSLPRVLARRFAFPIEGVSGGTAFQVPDGSGEGDSARVSMDARGRFVIVWRGTALEPGLRGKLFRPNGRPLGRDFLVGFRPESASVQGTPAVALDADGDFSVSFYGSTGSSPNAVLTRRFRGPEPIDLEVTIKARPPSLAPGEETQFIAAVTNLHPRENLTGIEAIDSAIGAAIGRSLAVDLPANTHVGRRMDFVPGGDGRCRSDETSGDYFCFSEEPLPAGDFSPVKFGLIPEIAGRHAVSVRVLTSSLDPATANNLATEEIEAVAP